MNEYAYSENALLDGSERGQMAPPAEREMHRNFASQVRLEIGNVLVYVFMYVGVL